jgi:hypothetical protein
VVSVRSGALPLPAAHRLQQLARGDLVMELFPPNPYALVRWS